MQKSEKMNLNLFEETDYIRPESFNENTQIIDKAIYKAVGWEMGAIAPKKEVLGSTYITLEFERKPLFVYITNELGQCFALQGQSHVQTIYNTSRLNSSAGVTAAWEGNKVILEYSGNTIMAFDEFIPYYIALVE